MSDLQTAFLWYFAFAGLGVVPLRIVFRRAGLRPWPSLAIFLPLIGLAVAASCLAYPKWPALPEKIRKPVRRIRIRTTA